jgi:hypothetical protein
LQAGHLDVLDLARTPPATITPERVETPPPAPPPAVKVAPDAPPRAPAAAAPPDAEGLQPLNEAPPTPGPARDTGAEASTRGWWLTGAGVVLTAVAVALIPISGSHIDDNRKALAGECVDAVVNDTCMAIAGHREAAQSYSDSIATWKAVRTGAWIGVGVGVATIATGLILRTHDRSAAGPRPALVLDHDGGHLTLGLAWAYRF